MTNKKLSLSFFLLVESVVLGVLLGLLDFVGFLSGEHALNLVYLGLAFFTWHTLGLTIFLMDLEDSAHEVVYLSTAVAFGILFFVFNQNYLAALIVTCSFFLFQIYTEKQLAKRVKMFINYSTREVVFPVIRRSFLFLMVILVVIGFFQGRRQAHAQTGIITPYMMRTLSRPAVFLLNKQFSVVLQKQLGGRLQQTLGTNERQALVTFILSETLESFTEGTTRQSFGLNRENIPLDKTIIYDNGDIDLTPVINDMSETIARSINKRLSLYLPFIPLFFGMLIFLLVSPLMTISEIVFLPLIRFFISLLLKLKVITIAKESVDKEILKL